MIFVAMFSALVGYGIGCVVGGSDYFKLVEALQKDNEVFKKREVELLEKIKELKENNEYWWNEGEKPC